VPSPTVIEFDTEGNVVNAWNPKGVQAQIHGCFVDYQDNIWIAGNGDGIVEKWKHDGSIQLLQIGTQASATTHRRTLAATRAVTRWRT
jgi:hypothetical protein